MCCWDVTCWGKLPFKMSFKILYFDLTMKWNCCLWRKAGSRAKMHVFEEQIFISGANINHGRNDCNSMFSFSETIKCFTRLRAFCYVLIAYLLLNNTIGSKKSYHISWDTWKKLQKIGCCDLIVQKIRHCSIV